MKPYKFLLIIIIFILIVIFTISSKENYIHEDHPILNEVRERFGKIKEHYKNIPLQSGKKSYTENKSMINLCLKNPETGKYYNMDVIMYVALHELAHVITDEEGHTDNFRNNFQKLLKRAEEKGIYDSSTPIPHDYCGVGPDND